MCLHHQWIVYCKTTTALTPHQFAIIKTNCRRKYPEATKIHGTIWTVLSGLDNDFVFTSLYLIECGCLHMHVNNEFPLMKDRLFLQIKLQAYTNPHSLNLDHYASANNFYVQCLLPQIICDRSHILIFYPCQQNWTHHIITQPDVALLSCVHCRHVTLLSRFPIGS